MASASIMRILDTARFHAPGALDGVLRLELFNVAKEFFDTTDSWREYLTIFIDPNAFDYDLITLSKGVIRQLMRLGVPVPTQNSSGVVTVNPAPGGTGGGFSSGFSSGFQVGQQYAPQAGAYKPTQFSRSILHMRGRSGVLVASGTADAILRVYELPNVAETWVAEVALTVSDPTDGDGIPFMPDWFVQKYQEAFLDGLLSKVMVHPAKPYTNKEAAAFHGRKFLSGIGTARMEARHGSVYGAQRWAYPQSFRTTSQRSRF